MKSERGKERDRKMKGQRETQRERKKDNGGKESGQ